MENCIEYAVNMCHTDVIDIINLPEAIRLNDTTDVCDCALSRLDDLEKREIEKALSLYSRNKEGINEIVNALGISRATLYRKIKQYKL
jgi:transcriptional regulator of acetoin/glycerol metabolism